MRPFRSISSRKIVIGGAVILAGFAAAQLPIPVFRNLSLGNVEIGTIKVPLWNVAFAQTGSDVTLENISLTLASTRFEAKRVVFSGFSGARRELEALSSETSLAGLADRVARIDARAVTISDLSAITQTGPTSRREQYKEILLKDVRQGKVTEAVAETITGTVKTDASENVSTFGVERMFASDIDVPTLVRHEAARSDRIDEPWTLVYRTVSLEGFTLLEPEEKTKVRIGRLSAQNVKSRPGRLSQSEIESLLSEPETSGSLSVEEQSRLMKGVAELFGSVSLERINALDLSVEMENDSRAGKGILKVARGSYAAERPDASAEIMIEGLELTVPDGRFSAASTSLTGFSFASSLENLRMLGDRNAAELDAATWRSLIPTFGTYRQSDIVIDMPGAANPIKGALRGFELTADKPLNGVPTNIRLMWDGFSLDLPSGKDDIWAQELRALGYRNLDISAGLALNWDPGANELVISDVSATVKDMGHVSLSGILGNVTKDAFDPDHGIAAAALLGARVKGTTLRIKDGEGLLNRIIAQIAKQQKVQPDKLRLAYAKDAAIVASSVLGDSPAAKTIARSLSDFIRTPRNLTLLAEPQRASGIPAIEIMAMPDPKAILEKVDIRATFE